MKFHQYLLITTILLGGCNASPSSSPSFPQETASSSSTGVTEQSTAMEQTLDRAISSQELGIALRYPSTIYDANCQKNIPVTAQTASGSIVFLASEVLGADCQPLPLGTPDRSHEIARIHAQRVKTREDVRQFIDRVFPDCVIDEESTNGDRTQIFLRSKNPPADGGPDLSCGESVEWNARANVALFSSLGSKTGGGIEWPASTVSTLSDGSQEGNYDFAIMRSITFID